MLWYDIIWYDTVHYTKSILIKFIVCMCVCMYVPLNLDNYWTDFDAVFGKRSEIIPGWTWTCSIFDKASKCCVIFAYLKAGLVLRLFLPTYWAISRKLLDRFWCDIGQTCSEGPGKYTEQHKILIDQVVFEVTLITAFFTDIFSYISKTTGPILIWFRNKLFGKTQEIYWAA